MGRRGLRCHIWGYAVCLCPTKGTQGLNELKANLNNTMVYNVLFRFAIKDHRKELYTCTSVYIPDALPQEVTTDTSHVIVVGSVLGALLFLSMVAIVCLVIKLLRLGKYLNYKWSIFVNTKSLLKNDMKSCNFGLCHCF